VWEFWNAPMVGLGAVRSPIIGVGYNIRAGRLRCRLSVKNGT